MKYYVNTSKDNLSYLSNKSINNLNLKDNNNTFIVVTNIGYCI